MIQPKALASLSSTLLARKGTARPAMRPQGFGGFGQTASGGVFGAAPVLDDLGWNDMGQQAETPAPAVLSMPPVPPVLVEREALKQEVEKTEVEQVAPELTVAVKSVSVATAARIGRETATKTAKGSKVAFTLRLPADRHLRLRLASAITNVSSQQLVTQALDVFLQSLPEVDSLVAQLPSTMPGARTGGR